MAYYVRRRKRTYGRRLSRRRGRSMRRGGVRKSGVAKLAAKVKSLTRRVMRNTKPVITMYKNLLTSGGTNGFNKFGTMGSSVGVVDLSNSQGMIHCINMQDLANAQPIFGPWTGWENAERCVIKSCKVRVRVQMNASASPYNDQKRISYHYYHVKLRKRCDLTETGSLGLNTLTAQTTTSGSNTYLSGTGQVMYDWMSTTCDNGTYWYRIGSRVVMNPEYFQVLDQGTFEVGPSFATSTNPVVEGAVMGHRDYTEKKLFFQSRPQSLRQTNQPTGSATVSVSGAKVNDVPSKNEFVLIFSDDDRVTENRQEISVMKEFTVALP